MQATPLAEGCAIVAVVLGVIGLYLDSLAAVAGAMGLTGFLCGQGVLFLYRTARYADDLQVERVIKTRPVHVGIPVEVRTSGVGIDRTVVSRFGLPISLLNQRFTTPARRSSATERAVTRSAS